MPHDTSLRSGADQLSSLRGTRVGDLLDVGELRGSKGFLVRGRGETKQRGKTYGVDVQDVDIRRGN